MPRARRTAFTRSAAGDFGPDHFLAQRTRAAGHRDGARAHELDDAVMLEQAEQRVDLAARAGRLDCCLLYTSDAADD